MKIIILILFLLILQVAIIYAIGEGTYNNETYGSASYGISSLAQFAFSDNYKFSPGTKVIIDTSNKTNATLEIISNSEISTFVTIVQYNFSPPNVGADPAKSLNKFIDIAVGDSLKNNHDHSIIKLRYSDAEVTSANLDESTMRLYKWDGESWIKFDGQGIGEINKMDNVIFANTTSFRTWGIFGTTVENQLEGGSSTGGGGGCSYKWVCKEWTECSVDGSQTRICTNAGSCSGNFRKPSKIQNCIFIPPEVEEKTDEKISIKLEDEFQEDDEDSLGELSEEKSTDTTIDLTSITGSAIGPFGGNISMSGLLVFIFIILLFLVSYYWVLKKEKVQ